VRALLSVYDKTGLEALARGLVALGWDLVSSGGTSEALAAAGIPHVEVEAVTGAPAMLGGRVKTLHPKVHGGILADRSQPDHMADLASHGIETIDLVVCNLYPFLTQPSIETIDIGGPTMVLSDETRRRLARAAFAHTAGYDAAIVAWLDDTARPREVLPPTLHLSLVRTEDKLRYGENPHQQAARYRTIGQASWWDGAVQHAGLAMSYLNLYDAEAAWHLVHDLGDRPAAAIIKHANPCGVAVADDLAAAYRLALEGDERSAFGGVVALNRPLDDATAAEMVAGPQADVVIVPAYGPGTVDALVRKRRNTRLLEAPAPAAEALDLRQISGGFLVQDAHHFESARDGWRVVTRATPTEDQWRDAELAWRVCGHVKSNAIVLVADGQAVGIGAGQQNRVEAGEIAARKAAGRAKGGACASDAFYPFRDGVDAAAAAGVAVVVQPGGSLRDDEVIAAADEHGLAMVFTGERHFLH
jgi:phosphoribosylaminoimidazolecarboxamide formyltransferase/IMP cyclohydrolase